MAWLRVERYIHTVLVLLLLWGWVRLSPLPVLFTCIQGKVENACFVLIARLKHSLFFWMPLIMHFSSLNPPSLFSVSLCKHDLVTMSVWATVLQSEFEFITALFLEVWKFPTHPNRAWPSLACLCNTRRFARLALRALSYWLNIFMHQHTLVPSLYLVRTIKHLLDTTVILRYSFFLMHGFSEHLFVDQKCITCVNVLA